MILPTEFVGLSLEAGRPIFLYGKKGDCLFAMVSVEDFAHLNQWHWNIGPKGYATRTDRTNGKRTIYMHKEIGLRMGISSQMQVDHRNLNKLDNRRSNLRQTTNQMNQANVARQKNNGSGYKGVGFKKSTKKWHARLGVNGKRLHLGYFGTPEEAHAAYCKAAEAAFGEFARHN